MRRLSHAGVRAPTHRRHGGQSKTWSPADDPLKRGRPDSNIDANSASLYLTGPSHHCICQSRARVVGNDADRAEIRCMHSSRNGYEVNAPARVHRQRRQGLKTRKRNTAMVPRPQRCPTQFALQVLSGADMACAFHRARQSSHQALEVVGPIAGRHYARSALASASCSLSQDLISASVMAPPSSGRLSRKSRLKAWW